VEVFVTWEGRVVGVLPSLSPHRVNTGDCCTDPDLHRTRTDCFISRDLGEGLCVLEKGHMFLKYSTVGHR